MFPKYFDQEYIRPTPLNPLLETFHFQCQLTHKYNYWSSKHKNSNVFLYSQYIRTRIASGQGGSDNGDQPFCHQNCLKRLIRQRCSVGRECCATTSGAVRTRIRASVSQQRSQDQCVRTSVASHTLSYPLRLHSVPKESYLTLTDILSLILFSLLYIYYITSIDKWLMF